MQRPNLVRILSAALLLPAVSGCDGRQGAAPAAEPAARESTTHPSAKEVPMAIEVKSSVFNPGGMIPAKYTCDGEDSSPPLEWSGVPPQAKSLALISDDPDAPAGDWVHWIVYDIPAASKGFAAGVPKTAEGPEGSKHGKNSWGKPG